MDFDSFGLSIRPQKNIIELKNILFDFSNLNENHELFSINKKVVGQFKV